MPSLPELKAIHAEILSLLKWFDAFCAQNGVSYTLDAGTLLGGDSMDALSQKLLQFVLQVAEGASTKNELLNDRQIAIFKNGVTL